MKIAYFDCSSGISGNMLVGAFLDLGVPFQELQNALESLPISGYKIEKQEVIKHGFRATHFQVYTEDTHNHGHHPHRGLNEIKEIINQSALPEEVKERSLNSFGQLASAEATVHGTTPDKIHFHEVGAIDAIIDIVGAHWCWWHQKLERGFVSTVNVGGGTVNCAHGVLPVPAPATALLLQDYTLQIGQAHTELTTPTGAVLLRSFTHPQETIPPFVIEKIGIGAGTKDIKGQANILRLFIGECEEHTSANMEEICIIETNIDDMSGEWLPTIINELLHAGARDAFITPIIAKKGRPAYIITTLCEQKQISYIQEVLFKYTTTFGIRYRIEKRIILERKWIDVETPWGTVKTKMGYLGEHIYQISPEFEDCYSLSQKHNIPIHEIYHYARTIAQKLLKTDK
ncbi:MAG: nickel pincer cofactor biosynthesis protein LarC [Candidatus Hydrogenedens sp.]